MKEKLEFNERAENIFYLSPTLKIHSQECRYCHPDSEGWQQLESLAIGISQGYQACRLCCPPILETIEQKKPAMGLSEVELLPEASSEEEEEILSENETQLLVESNLQSPSNSQAESSNQVLSKPKAKSNSHKSNSQLSSGSVLTANAELESETLFEHDRSKEKAEAKKDYTRDQDQDKLEKKRYKILVGNGCHQAIAEVKGMLVRPSEKGDKFKLILPDGVELDATFKTPHLKWLAFNQDRIIGLHWFRGYPKMRENKLVCFQIIAWDGDMPTSPKGWERWEFTGLWTPQRNLTVQRSMGVKEIRSIAKETGFIKKFKFSFNNAQEWIASKRLWIGYVYKLLCRREGDMLKIQKVIPYACPRIKPSPKGRGKKRFSSSNQ